jgi:hypothetical protein
VAGGGYVPLYRTFLIDRGRLMLLQVPRDVLSDFELCLRRVCNSQ